MGDDNGNTIIPLTPKALAALIVALLALAGGGGTYLRGVVSGGDSEDHTSIAVLKSDMDTVKTQMREINRKLDRIIERNNEKDNR